MRTTWLARAVVAVIGLALCYVAATTALASAARRGDPELAMRLAPFNAGAVASVAFDRLKADQSSTSLIRSEAMARRALAREPINVAALRTLGLAAAVRGDLPAARARFTLVERLSRRDLATQFWWIEHEVARGSVSGALTYFDEALRTSVPSADTLMPILVQASEDAEIAAALVPFLSNRPSYFRQFFIQATDTTPNIDEVARLGRKLLNRRDPDDQDLINRIIMRLGRDKKYDAAWTIFTWASGTTPAASVVNGDFEREVPFLLFNWSSTGNDALSADVAPRDGSNALYLMARVGRGVATQQLLRLSPGRYELSALTGDVPDSPIDRPTIEASCADSDRPLFAPIRFQPSPAPATPLSTGFSVAPNCRYQWLRLTASASSEDETRAWIDDIRIRAVNGR